MHHTLLALLPISLSLKSSLKAEMCDIELTCDSTVLLHCAVQISNLVL